MLSLDALRQPKTTFIEPYSDCNDGFRGNNTVWIEGNSKCTPLFLVALFLLTFISVIKVFVFHCRQWKMHIFFEVVLPSCCYSTRYWKKLQRLVVTLLMWHSGMCLKSAGFIKAWHCCSWKSGKSTRKSKLYKIHNPRDLRTLRFNEKPFSSSNNMV